MFAFSLALVLAAPPTCADLLAGIRARTEANYAGFQLEVVGDRRKGYLRAVETLGREASTTDSDDCFPLLARYVAWFDDPHLFVYQSPRLDSVETRRRIASLPTMALDPGEVRRSIVRRGKRVDPIEGIWYDGAMEMAVVPDPAGPAGRFLAVVITSDTVTLPVGAVRAVISRRARGGYDTALRWPSLAITRPSLTLHRGGTVMRLSPGMWGKRFPGNPAERALLDSVDVHRPTLTWRGNVAIVSLTSHDGYRPLVDSLIAANQARIDSADALLIDLRGNEGGGSQTTAALEPWVIAKTPPPAVEHDEEEAVILSSPDQISYVKRTFGSPTSPAVLRLVAAMEAAPGQLVPLADPASPDPKPARPMPHPSPGLVAVLIDGGTVSASEVIALEARREGRASLVGEPTEGALDYQSVSIVRIHPDEHRWALGYPTITARRSLPAGGMRGKGIQPTVPLRWDEVGDPVAAVLARLGHP